MTKHYKHYKAFRCRIENTGRIIRLEDNWHVRINMSDPLQTSIDYVLENHLNENITIKSEKGGGSGISQGSINKPYVTNIGGNPVKDTTEWLRLIKIDGTVWTIRTVDNKHYVGEKIQ